MAGYTPYFNPYGGYNPQIQQPMQQPMAMPQPPQQAQNLVRVQGEEAAKAWPVAPGCSVPMMDIEAPYLYVKSVGMDGVPYPLRKFRVTEETDQPQTVPEWRVELDKIVERLDKLEGGMTSGQPSA